MVRGIVASLPGFIALFDVAIASFREVRQTDGDRIAPTRGRIASDARRIASSDARGLAKDAISTGPAPQQPVTSLNESVAWHHPTGAARDRAGPRRGVDVRLCEGDVR